MEVVLDEGAASVKGRDGDGYTLVFCRTPYPGSRSQIQCQGRNRDRPDSHYGREDMAA